MKNKCPTCKNCIITSSQVEYNEGNGFDPVSMRPLKFVKSTSWVNEYTCKFGVKDCPGVQKCTHYQKRKKNVK